MIQVYHGDGKGKTTAAVGLAVRAAGNKIPVLFVQFLKDDTSGEIAMLKTLGIDTLHPSVFYGFVSRMNEWELAETRQDCKKMLQFVKTWTGSYKDARQEDYKSGYKSQNEPGNPQAVVIFDEILHAVKYGLVEEKILIDLLQENRMQIEFILTGRDPSEKFLALADYVTEMKNVKHPYERGISARKGIEL